MLKSRTLKSMIGIIMLLCATGCASSPYATMDDCTMTVKGNIQVVVKANNKAEKKIVDEMIGYIENSPDKLTESLGTVYIYGETTKEYAGTELVGGGTAGYMSASCSKQNDGQNKRDVYMTAPVSTNSHSGNVDVESADFVHELWHTYDYKCEGTSISRSPEFVELYNAKPDCLGDYGATDSVEYFAEAGMWYTTNPDKLKKTYPELYNFFENLPM